MKEEELIERMKALRIQLRDLEAKAAKALAIGDNYLASAVAAEMATLSSLGNEYARQFRELEEAKVREKRVG